MITILLLAIAALALVLLLNRDYLATEHSLSRLPLLENRACRTESAATIFLSFGLWLKRLLPQSIIEELELEYLYLGRKLDLLHELLAQSTAVFLALILAYLINHNNYFLLAAFLIPALLLLEIKFAVLHYQRQLERDAAHLFACAKVLLINTETPLVSALRIMLSTWPDKDSATAYELNKIINKIDKLGLKEALSNWQAESEKFRDFLSFLLSVSEGASKRALRLALDGLIEELRQEQRLKLDERAENLQLYLMGPVLAMLLVIMYPMAAAINYMMQNSLLGGKGL